MTPKEHYDKHLAPVYSWMAGDFDRGKAAFARWLKEAGIPAGNGGTALDLGAGHGMQTMALVDLGYKVKALDFSALLLDELAQRAKGRDVAIVNADIREFPRHCPSPVSLICCWGDTLTHLGSEREVEDLFSRAADCLEKGGHLLLSFRDYTRELKDNERFIPVKSDDHRILTCFLEFFPMFIKVSDLLQERQGDQWNMKVSSYLKLRLDPQEVREMLEEQQMDILSCTVEAGLCRLVARKS
jgi:SAM-dependent methyltransferase